MSIPLPTSLTILGNIMFHICQWNECEWNLAVVFIPISLIIDEVEHFLVHYELSRMQSYMATTIYVLEHPFSLLCLMRSCSLCNTQFQCDPLGHTAFPILPARIGHPSL